MKKNIFIGIFSPLFYYLVFNIILYTILAEEYNEKYALLHSVLIIILPALPGVALIFLLIWDSLKAFFKSLAICFSTSLPVMFVYHRMDLMIYTKVTGYEEFSLGEEFILGITCMTYLFSCLIGSVIACIITCIRQRKGTAIATK